MKNKFVITLLAVSSLTVACSKKELKVDQMDIQYSSEESNAMSLYKFMETESSGNFIISSSMATDEQLIGPIEFSANGAVLDLESANHLQFGDLSIGNQLVSSEAGSYFTRFEADYFSDDVSITLLNTAGEEEINTSLYFPMPITSSTYNVPSPITVGSQITWNADPNNHKGVLIVFEYNMGDLSNVLNYGNYEEKQIFVENDIGSYIFTDEDLLGMNTTSSGSNNCAVAIVRGDYKMVYHNTNVSIGTKLIYMLSSPWVYTTSN